MDAAFIDECLDDELWAQRERDAIGAIHVEAVDIMLRDHHFTPSDSSPSDDYSDTLAEIAYIERRIAELDMYVADTKDYLWWVPVPPACVRNMFGFGW